MGKIIYEFKDTDADDVHSVTLINNRYKMATMLYNITDYIRTLRKYEERQNIPVEEIADKLSDIVADWYIIEHL